jgi:hypothetical protein
MARRTCTPAACPLIWRACLRSLVLALAVASRLIRVGRRVSVGSSLSASATVVPQSSLRSLKFLSRGECSGR